MQPIHEVSDQEKLESLKEAMRTQGWQGPPLVVHNKYVISGAYQYVAVKELEWDMSKVPTVTLEQLFSDAGLDLYGKP